MPQLLSIPDPTKTLTKNKTRNQKPLTLQQQQGTFTCNAGEWTEFQREPQPKHRCAEHVERHNVWPKLKPNFILN